VLALHKLSAWTSHWTGLSKHFLEMDFRQEVGLACPSRFFHLSTAWTSQFNNLLGGYVRELLGQAGRMTCRTSMSEQLAEAVWEKHINWPVENIYLGLIYEIKI
jgi:hypothetical protein